MGLQEFTVQMRLADSTFWYDTLTYSHSSSSPAAIVALYLRFPCSHRQSLLRAQRSLVDLRLSGRRID
jgi:hypothetical protein